MNKLIINADDFGRSEIINAAIKKAIEKRKITSVSVMVNEPYFEDAVKFLLKHREVAAGLHFDYSDGWRCFLEKRWIGGMLEELERQYAKLEKTGLAISHLDSHEHLHLYPPVYKSFVSFALKHRIDRVRMCEFSWRQVKIMLRETPSLKQLLIWSLYGLNNLLAGKNAKMMAVNRTIYDLNWHGTYRYALVEKIISILASGQSEVICHLSESPDGSPLGADYYRCQRFILNKRFDDIIKRIC